jgi:hypothetical protein
LEIDRADEAYFREQIEPMLQGPGAKDYIPIYRSLMKRPLPLPDGDPDLSVVRPIMTAEVN